MFQMAFTSQRIITEKSAEIYNINSTGHENQNTVYSTVFLTSCVAVTQPTYIQFFVLGESVNIL